MSEQFFGQPGATALGCRVFDLDAEGIALPRNFGLMQEAQGVGRVLCKSSFGLRPEAYGAIRPPFVAVRNRPLAIAIAPTGERLAPSGVAQERDNKSPPAIIEAYWGLHHAQS